MKNVADCSAAPAAQLPLANLGAALQQMPGSVAVRAAEFLDSPKCGPLPRQTQALVRERAAAVQAKEAAAKEAAAAAAGGAADGRGAEAAETARRDAADAIL